MAILRLSGKYQNCQVLVDDDYLEMLLEYKWFGYKTPSGSVYAVTRVDGKTLRMHRIILNDFKSPHIDHKNMNTLDNRRKNLRPCGASENGMNRPKQKNNQTGYKGVAFDKSKPNQPYLAQIGYKGKTYYIGRYANVTEASEAYESRAKELFGEFFYRP